LSLLIIKTSSRKEGNKIGDKLKWERSVRTEHHQFKRTAIVYVSTLSREEKGKKHSVDIDEGVTVGDLV